MRLKPSKDQLKGLIDQGMNPVQIARALGYGDGGDHNIRKYCRQYGFRWENGREILRPDEATLRRMLLEEKIPPKQVALSLGYSELGWSNIYALCREYGIKVDFKKNADLRAMPLSDTQKAIILGGIHGDGNIHPDGFFRVTHGEKQVEYLKWMVEGLGFLVQSGMEVKSRISKPPFSQLRTFTTKTVVHPWIKDLRNQIYRQGKKRIDRLVLSEITPLALAVWYMDDGSINRTYGVITIATNGFVVDDVKAIVEWLSSSFGIPSVLEKRRSDTWAIRINRTKARAFLEIVSPHIPDCMAYKRVFPGQ